MDVKRREKQRQAAAEEIKATARQLMQQNGTAGLSLRAISRELGLSSAALYYYYPSVADLITALSVDAFNSLTDTLAGIVHDETRSYADRGWRLALAYRQWALEHPIDFQLIYGNPIPGYEQPTAIVYPPARRGFVQLAGLIAGAITAGELIPTADYTSLPSQIERSLVQLTQHEGHNLPPVALYIAAALWSKMHGLVMLELFNLIQPVIADTDAFYQHETLITLRQIGLQLTIP
ncbi:MAG: TetR/AcrR family transcriptional regulator [Anaerolineae bacterium]|nr:TetR/AcrR family transcriptional regulator [Anaerolineae bacterium]